MNSRVDYALDCIDCGRIYLFVTENEREAELAKHAGHDFELFQKCA